jgi:hypothetical protein
MTQRAHRAITGPAVAALCAGAALLLGACGGSGEAATRAAEAVPSADVKITAPANGKAVVADDRSGTRLIGEVEVKGTATGGASLVVETSCEDADCRQSITTDTDGRFSTSVPIWAREHGHNGYVVVGAAGSAPADRDRVLVLLEAPKVKAPRPAKSEQSRTVRKRSKKRNRKAPSADELAARQNSESEAAPAAAPESAGGALPPAVPGGGPGRPLLMIGDSLAEGTRPYLGGMLRGWSVTTDAQRGRPLSEGMRILESSALPPGPIALAFSLFTNDSPKNVPALAAAVRRSAQLAGPQGCVVWATISRPPVRGVSYATANRTLVALQADPGLAGRLIVVPWATYVASNPGVLGPDRVHATSAGYRARAQLYANAAQSCRR